MSWQFLILEKKKLKKRVADVKKPSTYLLFFTLFTSKIYHGSLLPHERERERERERGYTITYK